MGKVQFNNKFKYTNIGTVVGTLCYFRPLERKDGSQYGGEFLINVKGHGSASVRVPSMYKVNEILDEFNVEDRPHVRVNMTQLDMYFAQSGKTYINFTSFAPFKAVGEEVQDTAKGNISGEVVQIVEKDGKVKLVMAVFNTDKDGVLVKNKMGEPLPVKRLEVIVTKEDLIAQINKEVKEGTNLTVGYSFVNKNDVSYDEYGLPVGTGERITRVEAGKLIVLENGKKEEVKVEDVFDVGNNDPFADGKDPFAFDLDDEDIPF